MDGRIKWARAWVLSWLERIVRAGLTEINELELNSGGIYTLLEGCFVFKVSHGASQLF